jgi:hypothetical protein
MTRFLRLAAAVLPALAAASFSQTGDWQYLGQTPPGDTPELFAPGIVSVPGKNTHAAVFSPDGRTLIFSRYPDRTSYIMTYEDGKWNGPVESFFFGKEASISNDGNRIYYYTDGDIFLVEREAAGWGAPMRLGPNINTAAVEFYPSLAASGDLYFSRDGNWKTGRVMVSRFLEGVFQTAEDLGETVNSGGALHAWVAPDESLMLFNSVRPGSRTQLDIWASFRNPGGAWSDPVNLGDTVNRGADAILCPTVSRDGRFLFFTRLDFAEDGGNATGLVYWMKTDFLSRLRPSAVKSTPPAGERSDAIGSGSFRLHPNFPNPFNARTRIRWSQDRDSDVALSIRDLLGRPVRDLVGGRMPAGEHSVEWDGSDCNGMAVAGGLYLCSLQAAGCRPECRRILSIR